MQAAIAFFLAEITFYRNNFQPMGAIDCELLRTFRSLPGPTAPPQKKLAHNEIEIRTRTQDKDTDKTVYTCGLATYNNGSIRCKAFEPAAKVGKVRVWPK